MSIGGERRQGKPGSPIPYGFGISQNPTMRFSSPSDSLKLRNYVVTGITKASGAPISGVTVDVFETLSDIFRGRAISDTNGIYIVNVNAPDSGLSFYARGNIAGAPEKSGTTVEIVTVTEL